MQAFQPQSSISVRRGVLAPLLCGLVAFACETRSNYLGFDRLETANPNDGSAPNHSDDTSIDPPSTEVPAQTEEDEREGGSASPSDDPSSDPVESEAEAPTEEPEGTEPVSMEAGAEPSLTPLTPMVDLPNHFVEVLGVTETDTRSRVEVAFQQLFFGDSDNQTIYYEVGEDQAYIYDALHNDTRIDALGYGMLVTVQVDHQAEFNRLWNYTKLYFQYQSGPYEGYFRQICDVSGESCREGTGVFGAFLVTTALLMAEGRWGNGEGIYDYGAEARSQLRVMREKETLSGGVVDGVVNLFDGETHLPRSLPEEAQAGTVNPGTVMPAFFEYWGAVTGDVFWTRAAHRGREFLINVAHPRTGLAPRLGAHDGSVPAGDAVFNESAYPVGFNLAVDQAWFREDRRQVDVANRLVRFFYELPDQPYPAIYSQEGGPLNWTPSGALVALNGATAGIASIANRDRLIRVVWLTPMPQGIARFYDGINQLLSLLYLSGQLRAY